MTQGTNLSLEIKSGESLSYVIDKKLDTDLGVDVKLGLSEWNSVFNLIKAEQVSTNKDQFGSKDTDIKNGKHFVVHEGTYEIAANVWTQIVNIAKQKMGITTTEVPEEKPTEPVVENNEEKPTTQTVTTILSNAGVSTEGLDIDDITNKYISICEYYSANNIEKDARGLTAQDRIVNYVKALQTHNTEIQFAHLYETNAETSDLKIEITGVKEAVASFDGKTQESFNQAMQKQNDAFHQTATEQIELYDTDNDGKVSVRELIEQSIKDEEKRLGRALTAEEKTIVQQEAVNRVALLDQNQDNDIDQNEMAAFVWATAKVNDTETSKSANDITYNEWVTTEETMSLLGLPEGELTQDDINQIGKFQQTLKNGYEGLKR